ncbi:MAG: Cof-type HAD-IIB family hydrolase [Erysipelotrichaceae bacterium]|nr:Cof-type HAD-IIB family hydrolase [Erysipelotrichaceae bacterium]
MYKALIFDVDDTLIKVGEDRVPESAIEAINRAREKGLTIIVATGRGYKFLHRDVKNRVKADYYVLNNGGSINTCDGTTVAYHPMTLEQTEKLIELCKADDYPLGFKFDDTLQAYWRGEDFLNLYVSKAITRDMLDDNSATMDYHLTHGLPCDGFMFSPNHEAMKYQDIMPDLFFYKANKKGGVECFQKGVNKGNSLKQLIGEILGYDFSECIAFGDSDNDVEMLQVCGTSVCMGNGSETAKAAADYITTDIDDDGIANALKHFGII